MSQQEKMILHVLRKDSERRLPVHLGILQALAGIVDGLARQGAVDQVLLLQGVESCVAAGRRRRWCPARVAEFHARLLADPQVVPDLVPGSLVARLFLAPDDLTRIVVLIQQFAQALMLVSVLVTALLLHTSLHVLTVKLSLFFLQAKQHKVIFYPTDS